MVELLLVALGVATMYHDSGFTACGLHTSEIDGPSLAVPWELLGTEYRCGDLVIVWGYTAEGEPWYVDGRVWDTGNLSEHCVLVDGLCMSILFDIRQPPFDGLSAFVMGSVNVSEQAREWQAEN